MHSQVVIDEILLFCARVTVAGVFLAAGALKLRRLGAFRNSLASWGVSGPAAQVVAYIIPVFEIVGAIGLLCQGMTTKVAALGTFLLSSFFSLAISYKLIRGSRPSCHCFGEGASSPISLRHLGHALFLGAAALLIALPASQDLPPIVWRDGSVAALPLLFVAGVVASVVLRGASRRGQENLIQYLLTSVDELRSLPIGTPAPGIELRYPGGDKVSLDHFCGMGLPVAFIFVNPDCALCKLLLARLNREAHVFEGRVTVMLVSPGEAERTVATYGNRFPVLLQENERARVLLRSNSTPSAVLIDSDCRIASAVVNGPEAIEKLVKSVIGQIAKVEHQP
jgi:uncharacterized membrane protein YphA (DoxX/SURF4 family)